MTLNRSMGERYIGAINSSNLKIADRPTDTDTIIAAGLATRRLGAMMRRLNAEWDGSAKPHFPNQMSIDRLEKSLDPIEGDTTGALRAKQARAMAMQWFEDAQRELMGKLKSLVVCRRHLAATAVNFGIEDPLTTAGMTILYWLDQNCHACSGRMWKTAPGTVYLSNKQCSACHGKGVGPIPRGEAGRKLLNHIDYCVGRADQERKDWVYGHRFKSNGGFK